MGPASLKELRKPPMKSHLLAIRRLTAFGEAAFIRGREQQLGLKQSPGRSASGTQPLAASHGGLVPSKAELGSFTSGTGEMSVGRHIRTRPWAGVGSVWTPCL